MSLKQQTVWHVVVKEGKSKKLRLERDDREMTVWYCTWH